MPKKTYKATPHLKVSEWCEEQGGGAYIAFDEYVNIPGLENTDIRLEFRNIKSLEEVRDLAQKLKAAGLVFVVQK